MSRSSTNQSNLERDFLPLRAKILEIAASLDRIQRENEAEQDCRELELIRSGIDILQQAEPGRAEQVQLLFSRPYEDGWRNDFGL